MVAGIALVNLLWAAISVFGIGLIISTLPVLLSFVQILGATYLIWFGIRLIRRSSQPNVAGGNAKLPGVQSALRDGIATNLANPNSMMFYASVFAGAIPATASLPTMLSLVVMVGVIGILWYGSVAMVFSSARVADLYRRGKKLIEIGCGLFLMGFAIRTLLTI